MNYDSFRDHTLLVMGDTHSLEKTFDVLHKIEQRGGFPDLPFVLVLLGDCGAICRPKETVSMYCAHISDVLNKVGGKLLMIRGNHDNPWFFGGEFTPTPMATENAVFFIKDHTVLNIDYKRVVFVGGSYSMDYDIRTPGYSYFTDELPVPPPPHTTNADIVLAHQLPGSMAPLIVRDIETARGLTYAPPAELQTMIDTSNATMQLVLETYQPKKWYCGHYHHRANYTQGECVFRVLAPEEILLTTP